MSETDICYVLTLLSGAMFLGIHSGRTGWPVFEAGLAGLAYGGLCSLVWSGIPT